MMFLVFDTKRKEVSNMTIEKRINKKGTSYLIRVSLGYVKGKQITRAMTYKPEEGMKPRAIEKELNRQAVLYYSVKPNRKKKKTMKSSMQKSI